MNVSEHFPILVIVLPLISAFIIPFTDRINRHYGWLIATVVTFVSVLLSSLLLNRVLNSGRISYWIGGWEPPWGIEYVIDYLNAFILVIVSFISFIVTLYSRRSVEMEIDACKTTTFYSIYMLLVTGLMGIVITGDIFNLYVFIEIAALAGYGLIAIGRKRDALIASYNYLILGTIAATFILLGIGYLYMATGTLNMADLRERLPMLYRSKMILTAFAFFTVGLSLKLALFPLHTWLPNAYTYAPSVVSAIMAATSTKVGAYAMFRIMFTVFKVEFDLEAVPVMNILLVLSSIAVIAGSVLAIAQTNIKRMLAYSSVGQIGYIVLGAALANQIALTGSLLHILNHALMKGTLFLAVGMVIYKTGIEDVSGLRGMGVKMPYSMAAFTIGGLSMIGIPLTVGFVSKWYIAIGALRTGMWFIVPIILLSSLLTTVYFWRIIESIYFPEKSEVKRQKARIFSPLYNKKEIEGPEKEKRGENNRSGRFLNDAPLSMLIPTLVLAGLCIFFGIAAFLPLSIVEKASKMLLGGM